MTTSVQVPATCCPNCHYVLDGASSWNDVRPAPIEHDLSVCINCATPLVFQADLTLKALSDAERNSLSVYSRAELAHAISVIETMVLLTRINP